jgi:class 3 adenylate cyclase/tetratricopeptide (TPR) repeat protein
MTGTGADRGGLSARVETRRLTIMFCDVVGSTELSARLELEAYLELIRRYRVACREVVESRFDGHVVNWKGDGAMVAFGFPVAHENDAERAVRAGLALVEAVHELSDETQSTIGEALDVRVGVHHGDVMADFHEDDINGFAANLVARLQTLAEPGMVVVSDEIRQLVEQRFEIEPCVAQELKGVGEAVTHFRVAGERRIPDRRSWSTPLVEREVELGQLREAWDRVAADGRPAGVLIRGDAGVGKTRLVCAFAEAIDAEVLWLHGSPFHLDAGFHPVRGLVESRCGIRDDTTGAERLACLRRDLVGLGLDPDEMVPLLAPVLRIEPSAGYDEAQAEGAKLEQQVAEAVHRYVVACTQPQPAAIVGENVHWFDAATKELLLELLRPRTGGALVIRTSRHPEAGRAETIELGPLTFAGRLALIDALDADLSEADRLAHASRSGGVPLYVEELVQAGAIERPIGDDAPVPGSVPAVLYEPLVARLYAAPDALRVAAAAAAAGPVVDRSLLAAAVDEEDLDASLRTLVDAHILELVQGRPDRYRFRHELLRELAYELQPPSRRRSVHSRLGDHLRGDRDEPGDWHVLASHFVRAGRHMDAAAAFQNTAEWARRRGALQDARDELKRAIDLVEPLAADAARDHRLVELCLRRGFLAMTAEGVGSEDASKDFTRCLELAEADPRGDDMFSTLISLWAYYLSRAELDRARELSTTLRSTLGGGRDFFRPQNLAGFGMLDWFGGSFASAVATLTTATGDLAAMGDRPEVAAAWFVPNDPDVAMHVHLGLARFMTGDPEGADESLAEAREAAAALEFPQGPWSMSYTAWLGSWMWIEARRLDKAEEAVADLCALSELHGFVGWEIIGDMQSAVLEAIAALPSSDAAALTEHADVIAGHIDAWRMFELRIFLPFYITTAGVLLAAAGDAEGARERYRESLELAAETGMRFYDAETMRRLALLESDADGLQRAADLARSQAARPFERRIEDDLKARQTA